MTVLDQRDHNNCDLTSPSADNADWRPTGPPVTELTGVKAISACNYAGGALISSVRLHGPAAARAIAAVRKAPFGAGPTSPTEDCLPDDLTAVEHLILRVESDSGAGIIVLRYGGCFHRGFDDGTTVRTLTRAGVQPFVTGPNRVTGWNGEQMSAVLAPCSPSRSTC